ncbi:MAG: hypothetical protein CFK49_09605 [Armatimonadetes bacterium JP3_11]|jgi:hypothetical protein|nr:MAG: hypothetical protein CFK49_09605 [Armatimonadetes bacterium JP3_11]RMH07268.1 MAG: hypothetical protein D6697_08965 [Armatimonadota bacterium]
MEILQAIEKLGYPIAVSAWLMWFVSAHGVRTQRLIEWAVAVKHQIDDIQQCVHLILRTQNMPLPRAGEGQGVRVEQEEDPL